MLRPNLCDISLSYLFSVVILLAVQVGQMQQIFISAELISVALIFISVALIIGGLYLRRYAIRYALIANGICVLLFGGIGKFFLLFLIGLFSLFIVSYAMDSFAKFDEQAVRATFANVGRLIVLISVIGLSWLGWSTSLQDAKGLFVGYWIVPGAFIILPLLCYLCKYCKALMNQFYLSEYVGYMVGSFIIGLILFFMNIMIGRAMPNLDVQWAPLLQLILSLPVLFVSMYARDFWLRFVLLCGVLVPFYIYMTQSRFNEVYTLAIFLVLFLIAGYLLHRKIEEHVPATQRILMMMAVLYFFFINTALIFIIPMQFIVFFLAGGYGQ